MSKADGFLDFVPKSLKFLPAKVWCSFFKKCGEWFKLFLRKMFPSKYKNNIWSNGTGSLNVLYGDLLKIAFSVFSREEKIVVINVDTSFATKVEGPTDKEKPGVSSKTLHGKWINKIKRCESDETIEKQFADRLKEALEYNDCRKREVVNGSMRYEVGSLVWHRYRKTYFLLVAFSEFDENNNAHATEDDLKVCLRSIIEKCDRKGQGYDVYLPLMGTGMSRVGLSYQSSFEITKEVFNELNKDVHSNFTIVAPEKAKDKLKFIDKKTCEPQN